jgi:type VI secretion system protein ImpK
MGTVMIPPSVQERSPQPAAGASPASENLALFYQGLLTGIVRLQAHRQHIQDAESFRRRTISALKEVERDAITAGYDGSDIRDTHFAVVAFLDAVVLNSNDGVSAEWRRRILEEELFGTSNAGMIFFEKLEHFRSRRDSPQLGDILEVYLLCLLLGFEGRYAGGLRGELESITEKVRRRIDDIRGRSSQISPNASLPVEGMPVALSPNRDTGRLRLVTLTVLVITILWYFALNWQLSWASAQVHFKLF